MNTYFVYKHTNKINNKIYIGITCQDVEQRWRRGNGYYNQKYFFSAIQKYGWDNFKHEILFSDLSKEQACKKEQELIQQYKSNQREFGYNLTNGGEGTSGHRVSEEYKIKNGKRMKEYWQENREEKIQKFYEYTHSKEANEKRKKSLHDFFKNNPNYAKEKGKMNFKKVKCLETQEIFESIKAASIWCEVSSTSIVHCLKGDQKSAGKHPITKIRLHWEYVDEKDN